MLARSGWMLLTLLSLVACEQQRERTPARAARPSTSAGAPRPILEAQLSSASAFELVAKGDGLRVVWANPSRGADWLMEAELSHDGGLRAAPQRVIVPARTLGKVTDLAATFVGDDLALAWLEQGQHEARAEATVVGAAAPPHLLDLGPAALVADSARGNLEIAAELDRKRALVMWRGLEAPCFDGQATGCVGFTFRRVQRGSAEATGLPLSVPVPCASHSVALAVSAGRFHYGVCTRDGSEPSTTMFTIQYAPEYARAEPLLHGCSPLGTIEAGGRPWLVGDCRGRRRAVMVPLFDEKVEPEGVDALQISCTPSRAELRQGRFVLTLSEPRADLQAVLPAGYLPTGARAGWTGSSLVVAHAVGTRLETRAFGCRGSKLEAL
jgi:hypothetical protein